jgi:hypothetical protein
VSQAHDDYLQLKYNVKLAKLQKREAMRRGREGRRWKIEDRRVMVNSRFDSPYFVGYNMYTIDTNLRR